MLTFLGRGVGSEAYGQRIRATDLLGQEYVYSHPSADAILTAGSDYAVHGSVRASSLTTGARRVTVMTAGERDNLRLRTFQTRYLCSRGCRDTRSRLISKSIGVQSIARRSVIRSGVAVVASMSGSRFPACRWYATLAWYLSPSVILVFCNW